ncbi:MAG TPA: DUF4174 domain-containing protein [Anaerohalosphaeraceae bacterium]|nr:DUF4174 domain-containing protein [Anaerohalosphaeraceae bacterium]HOL89476.1 DUF4174 domain-containing protein [Anaerohalosphaeraceae bacterium]HPP55259.1 DUF4174 domain-containing protein [Anaerohalosphaeraceae bacterium]
MVIPRPRLSELKAQPPLLIIFSPTPDHRCYQMQVEQLESIRLAMQDCRLTVAEIFEQGQGRIGQTELPAEGCARFREKFRICPGQFKVFLVGSDSEVHLVSEDCISWQELLMRVDNAAKTFTPSL